MIDMQKSRQELINQCRYYKGEEENPYKDYTEGLLRDYESSFVADPLSAGTPNNKSLFGVDEYIGCGLKDFQKDDCHHIELKARLFNRYAKGCYSMLDAVEPFKEFYLKYYQAGCADP